MVATLVVLGVAFRTEPAARESAAWPTSPSRAWRPTSLLRLSLGPIVWLMISETYPLRNRAQVVAVSTAANSGANFLVSTTFPVMTRRLGSSVTVLATPDARLSPSCS